MGGWVRVPFWQSVVMGLWAIGSYELFNWLLRSV